ESLGVSGSHRVRNSTHFSPNAHPLLGPPPSRKRDQAVLTSFAFGSLHKQSAERYANQIEQQLEALEQKLDELLAEFERPIDEDAKHVPSDVGNEDGLKGVGVGKPVDEEVQPHGQGACNATTSMAEEVRSGEFGNGDTSDG